MKRFFSSLPAVMSDDDELPVRSDPLTQPHKHTPAKTVQEQENSASPDALLLHEAAQFLLSLAAAPDETRMLLQQNCPRDEYDGFLKSVQRLKQAHHRVKVVAAPQQQMVLPSPTSLPTPAARDGSSICNSVVLQMDKEEEDDETVPFDERTSFLQRETSNDLMLQVLNFLECRDLARTGETCTHFRSLVQRSVQERCPAKMRARQLPHMMQLLRCAEQMDGVGSVPHVPFPMLLPHQRIVVRECGDFEYNGIYHCTSFNGNGYVFTKPRSPR